MFCASNWQRKNRILYNGTGDCAWCKMCRYTVACLLEWKGSKDAMKKQEKTNVMRILDQKKIPYEAHFYDSTEAISGTEVAEVLGQNPKQVFKTLVTVGASKRNYVFVVPVWAELHLKKAAKAVGEKSIEMIKSKELLPLTGYIHGGCSPIGMKKFFTTTIHETAKEFDTIIFSGGKIGCQVEMKIDHLAKVITFQIQDICEEV